MEDDKFEDGLEALWKSLGASTKRLDNSDNHEILKKIKEMEMQEKKIKPSTQGEESDADLILPQWSVSGKKVHTMTIRKRRIDIEPMGF